MARIIYYKSYISSKKVVTMEKKQANLKREIVEEIIQNQENYSVEDMPRIAEQILTQFGIDKNRVIPIVRIAEDCGFTIKTKSKVWFVLKSMFNIKWGSIITGSITVEKISEKTVVETAEQASEETTVETTDKKERKVEVYKKEITTYKKDNPYQQRFVIAHELAHFLFDCAPGTMKFVDYYRKDNHINESEIKANAFAANLLMPRDKFIEKYMEVIKTSPDPIYVIFSLATYFGVPQKAVLRRFDEVINNVE